MFRRWRNLALLGVLVVLPVVLGIGLRVSTPDGGGGGPNASFFAQLAGNGVFLSFLALTILLTLVLPLVIAVVAGDSIAGEAGAGTLRYLLTVPAGRARLLSVKYAAVVIFGLAACLLVSAVSLIMGAILFPIGPVTLLSGTTVSLADGLLRLLYVTLYVAAGMAALAAIGLAISTLTEHPIGAIAAILVLAVASEVADNVGQFAVIHPLPADALLAVVRLAAARAGQHRHPAARAAVVRGVHHDLRLDRLGPLHQRRRHQLSQPFVPAAQTRGSRVPSTVAWATSVRRWFVLRA